MTERQSNTFAPMLGSHLRACAYRCLADSSFSVLEIEGNTNRITGYSVEEFRGREAINFADLIHPDDRQSVLSRIQEDLSHGDYYDVEYRLLQKSGEYLQVQDQGEGVYEKDKLTELIGIISPATQRDIRQRKQKRAQETIVRLARSAYLARGDVEAFSREVAFAATEILGVDRASVWLLNSARDELRQLCLYEKEHDRYSSGTVLRVADYPDYFKALVSGRAIDAVDVATDERTREFSKPYFPQIDVRSMLDSAIRSSGEVIGSVCSERVGKIQHWYNEDISFSGELSDQLTQAIANRQHIESEAQARVAQVASETKSQLLATISHELRTPMNGILGMVDLLDVTKLDAQQRNYLLSIRDSGELLLTLINDVLDYSKLEAGELKLVTQPTRVSSLFRSVVDLLSPLTNRGVSIKLEGQEHFPAAIDLDDNRVRQLLFNIIGNAIKYTVAGSIVVKYAVIDRKTWMIDITDTGTGIHEEVLPTLFEPFTQSRSTINNQLVEGAGLGLSICKKLVETMAGRISADSGIGRGTTVRIELPLVHAVEHVKNRTLIARDATQQFTHLRVLVAEDNAISRQVIVAMLKLHGIVADLAVNGVEAVEQFQRADGRYDLLLMDCEMPKMDGFTASKKIRSLQKLDSNLTIAALTAHALDDYRERADAAKMDIYLTKPIRIKELSKLLRNIA